MNQILDIFQLHQVTIVTLELASPTLVGRTLVMNVQDPTAIEHHKKFPFIIKEGVEYK